MKRTFSLEIFPPKRTSPIETIYRTLDGLRSIQPDFISVTYGAGGSQNAGNTLDIVSKVQNEYQIPAVAHLPGLHLSKDEVVQILERFSNAGVRDILALRGDPVDGAPMPGDFPYAADLIRFIKGIGDFHVNAACYPETHPSAVSEADDLRHLKEKVDAGAERLITQLLLQGADMGTDGGLGQKQLLRRPCEAGAVRRGDEGLQLFQIDIYHNITFLFP